MFHTELISFLLGSRVFPIQIYQCCFLNHAGSTVRGAPVGRYVPLWGLTADSIEIVCWVIMLAAFAESISIARELEDLQGSLRAWSPDLWEFVSPKISACVRLRCLLRSLCCLLHVFCFISLQ